MLLLFHLYFRRSYTETPSYWRGRSWRWPANQFAPEEFHEMVQLVWDPGGRVSGLYIPGLWTLSPRINIAEVLSWGIKSAVILLRFTQYQRMLGILAQCEFSMGKTLMVYDMNLQEMENYEQIYSNIGKAGFSEAGTSYFVIPAFPTPLSFPPLQNKTLHLRMRR